MVTSAPGSGAQPAHPTSGTNHEDYLELFGSPRIRYADAPLTPVPLRWGKPAALLAYLASRPGWHARDALVTLLRPDAGEAAARSYIRGLLHRIRHTLPQLAALDVQESRVRWRGRSDVQEFDEAIASGAWQRAIDLQQQDFLAGVGSTGEAALDDWIEEERVRLRQRLASALVSSIVQQHEQGRVERAGLMQKLVEIDPLDESAVQVALGYARTPLELRAAVSAFQTLRRRLEAELGEEPMDSTRSLHARAVELAAGGLGASEDKSLAPLSGTLAPPGRERDVGEIVTLLEDPSVRLLTIQGPGGVGKSTVAQAVHARVADRQGSRTIWIDLAGVDRVRGLVDAIAGRAGLPLHEGPAEQQLLYWMSQRGMLLFLDNFDALTSEATVLERWLQAVPQLRIVLTSREATGVPQEHLHALTGLACEGEDSAAARLFQLHAARAGRAVTPSERADLASLVAYLQGVPLMIELAASWVTLLPVGAILDEVKRDALFVNGNADGMRTMQSVFESMWSRLEPQEQEALLFLSTIRAPLDLRTAAARAYVNARVLLRLVRKSFLQVEDRGVFRMHPLLRGFVASRANPSELRAARTQHAERTLRSLEDLPPLRAGRYMPEVVQALLPSCEDLIQAWRVAVEEGLWDLLDSALANLTGFFLMVSRHEVLVDLTALTQAHAPPDYPPRGALAAVQALASCRLGHLAEAETLARAAIPEEPGKSVPRALLGTVISHVRRYRGDYAEALLHARQALQSIEGDGDPYSRLLVQENAAWCHWHLGQLVEARALLLDNLALAGRHDARYAEAMALALLGVVRDAMGDPAEALQLLQSSGRMFREMHDPYRIAYCRRAMSYVHLKLGDLSRQAEAAEASLAAFRAAGYAHEIAESLFAVAISHDAAGRAHEARNACSEALRLALRTEQLPIALRCVGALGALAAPADRELGFGLMAFAAEHPGLRRPDLAFIERRFAVLGASSEELAQARERARTWTFHWVCGRLLASVAGSD